MYFKYSTFCGPITGRREAPKKLSFLFSLGGPPIKGMEGFFTKRIGKQGSVLLRQKFAGGAKKMWAGGPPEKKRREEGKRLLLPYFLLFEIGSGDYLFFFLFRVSHRRLLFPALEKKVQCVIFCALLYLRRRWERPLKCEHSWLLLFPTTFLSFFVWKG